MPSRPGPSGAHVGRCQQCCRLPATTALPLYQPGAPETPGGLRATVWGLLRHGRGAGQKAGRRAEPGAPRSQRTADSEVKYKLIAGHPVCYRPLQVSVRSATPPTLVITATCRPLASHTLGLGYHGSTVLRGALLAMRSVSKAGNQITLPYYSLQIMVFSNCVASLSCS